MARPTLGGACGLAVLLACGGPRTTAPLAPPAPSPSVSPEAVIPGRATGPTALVFVSADPPPASTIAGCGAALSGCAGRIRMRFRLAPTAAGPALGAVGFLHAENRTACLLGRTGPFALAGGVERTVEVLFEEVGPPERCRPPLRLTDLALVVEGTIEVAARQEWALSYRLEP